MKLLDQIVDVLNDTLQSGVLDGKAFQYGLFAGLSYVSPEREGMKQRPYTWNGENIVDLTIEDTRPFMIYHRCTALDTKSNPSSFGDGNGAVNITASCIAIVYGDRFKLGMTQEDLALLISSGLRYSFTKSDLQGSGLQNVTCNPQRAIVDPVAVFKGEYGSGANYTLKPHSLYFAIPYGVEITANASCLTCQNC